ncbi:uncharacterized protein [Centruroides vittatus]|uniref:uncharacterized protein n=1 Tax=Centruroides vittatus TaxID=120091 RepID=UPI00350F2DED
MQRAIAAGSMLNKVMESTDIAIIQEPYVLHGKVAGLGLGLRLSVIHARCARPSAVLVCANRNIDIQFCEEYSDANVACADMIIQGKRTIWVSVYHTFGEPIRHTLNKIDKIMRHFGACDVIIGGDFNVHSPVWGGEEHDEEADDLLEFLAEHGLHILNDPDSPQLLMAQEGQVG